MVPACRSTVRFTSFGIWSHCSGVGLSRTAPPVAVRTPWWTSSMPAVFSSKNMPLYSRLKTSTSSPRCEKYSRSFRASLPSAAGSRPASGARRSAAARVRRAGIPKSLFMPSSALGHPQPSPRASSAAIMPLSRRPAPGPGRAEGRDRGILGLTRSPRVDREDIHEFRDPS